MTLQQIDSINHAQPIVQLIRWTPLGTAQHNLFLLALTIFLATLVGMCTENIWNHTTLFFYWWALFGVAGWNWSELKISVRPATISAFS